MTLATIFIILYAVCAILFGVICYVTMAGKKASTKVFAGIFAFLAVAITPLMMVIIIIVLFAKEDQGE